MENADLILIGLVDDAPQLRGITVNQLAQKKRFSIMFEADNGQQAIQNIEESKQLPDVCIVEDDFSTAKLLLQKYHDLKVLVSSTDDNEETVRDMLETGVAGYVLKFNDPDELVTAVNAISNGKRYFSLGVADIAQEYFGNS